MLQRTMLQLLARIGWGVVVFLGWGVVLTSGLTTTPVWSVGHNWTSSPMPPLDTVADAVGKVSGNDDDNVEAVEPGDIALGGLFMIHQAGEGSECGALASQMGIQALETMLYTVDIINNSTFLPGFKLGARALDDCNQESRSLEQSLRFVHRPVCENDSGTGQREAANVMGVVGSASSLNSITVANLLKLFKIPQISYWSTSPDLSNTNRFPYFFRAVPSDQYQAQAMIDIVLHFNWTYISIVYENSNYGVQGIEEVKKLAAAYDVCVAVKEMIPRDGNESAYDRIIQNLLKATDARAVILWALDESVARFFRAVRRANTQHKFIWIGSDSWSGRQLSTIDNEQVVEGAITIQPMSFPIPDFDHYFTNLNPLTYKRNPWFKEFWEEHFDCRLATNGSQGSLQGTSSRPRCTANLKLGSENNYSQEGQIQFVANSVWAFAYALRDMHRAYCRGHHGLCDRMRPIKGEELREFLRNVSFEASSDSTFQFTSNGDGPVEYKILNYQQVFPNKYKFMEVGYYKDSLWLNTSAIGYRLEKPQFPKSSCWRPCRHNEMKFKRDGECCWNCLLCQQYEYLQDEYTCTECPNGTRPSDNLTQCTDIQVKYMQPNTSSTIVALVFATVGEFATIFTACIYVRHRDTPVVKASGRELSGLLLVGVFLCYALTYLFLTPPTIVTCGLQQFLMGIAFTLCYASLLVKTNRVYRIFTSGKSTTKRPNFISPVSQIVITLILVLVQGFLSITWLVAVPPNAVKDYPTRGEVQIVCNAFLTSSSLLGLAFPLVLLILCTAFAFMTRKIPGHFNEAKCIGFTMYSSCIVWLAMIPIYILTKSNIQLRIVSLYIAISLCATVCLACLFLPRIYLILMRPERNVRITVSGGPRRLKLTGSVYPNSSSNHSNHSPYSHVTDHGRNNTL